MKKYFSFFWVRFAATLQYRAAAAAGVCTQFAWGLSDPAAVPGLLPGGSLRLSHGIFPAFFLRLAAAGFPLAVHAVVPGGGFVRRRHQRRRGL